MARPQRHESPKPSQIDFCTCEPESLVPASGRPEPTVETDRSLYRAHLIVASATDAVDSRAEVSLYHHPRFGNATPLGRYPIDGVYPTKQEAVRAALRFGVHMVDRLRGSVDSERPGEDVRKPSLRETRR
jgi:hypothetical protein